MLVLLARGIPAPIPFADDSRGLHAAKQEVCPPGPRSTTSTRTERTSPASTLARNSLDAMVSSLR
jgi:hypothetical protein